MLLEADLSEAFSSLVTSSQPGLAPLRLQVSPAANAAVIVAHPDDETLWAGGTILSHPEYHWFVASLCRQSDPDRSQKFFDALQRYGAAGAMADLDDGPEQIPLEIQSVQQALLRTLPPMTFDLLLTHAPEGEYTRHLRHEEVSQAVMGLWRTGLVQAGELRLFAYEDAHGQRLPRAIENAHHFEALPEAVYMEKYRLITEVYGFGPDSWEAKSVPHNEAFWCFETLSALQAWLDRSGEA